MGEFKVGDRVQVIDAEGNEDFDQLINVLEDMEEY